MDDIENTKKLHCKHLWLDDPVGSVIATMPAIYITTRKCAVCGKEEKIKRYEKEQQPYSD